MFVRRSWLILALLVVITQQAYLLAPTLLRAVFPAVEDEAARGGLVAARLGCFACHGAEGAGGIPNPGAGKQKMVPAFSGGEMMMWADSEQELRDWIVRGHTERAKSEKRSGLSAGQGTGRALVMPAFKSHLGPGELDSLLAYLRAISGLQFPEDGKTRVGLELLHERGCFRCHGPMGTGGTPNPGSLKGYVPGFFGDDYAELVRGPEEAREWIRDGVAARLRDNPLAAAVIGRQALKMPAYGEHLSDEQVDSLVAAVSWLASGKWRAMKVP